MSSRLRQPATEIRIPPAMWDWRLTRFTINRVKNLLWSSGRQLSWNKPVSHRCAALEHQISLRKVNVISEKWWRLIAWARAQISVYPKSVDRKIAEFKETQAYEHRNWQNTSQHQVIVEYDFRWWRIRRPRKWQIVNELFDVFHHFVGL